MEYPLREEKEMQGKAMRDKGACQLILSDRSPGLLEFDWALIILQLIPSENRLKPQGTTRHGKAHFEESSCDVHVKLPALQIICPCFDY